jgi:hypothetical protein
LGERSFERILAQLSQTRTQIKRPAEKGADTNFGIPTVIGILGVLQLVKIGALAQEPQYAAVIEESKGDVFLIPTYGGGKERLDPDGSIGRVLYVGETVHLSSNASLRVRLFNHREEVVQQNGPSEYVIPENTTRVLVERLQGEVALIKSDKDPEKTSLQEAALRDLTLHGGERLQLSANAGVQLRVFFDNEEVMEKKGPDDYAVPQTSAKTDPSKVIEAVQKICGIAGRTAYGDSRTSYWRGHGSGAHGHHASAHKGSGSIGFRGGGFGPLVGGLIFDLLPNSEPLADIYSPANDSAVWPDDLKLEWCSRQKEGSIDISITDEASKRLWHENLPAQAGYQSLDSNPARLVLRSRQGKGLDLKLIYREQSTERVATVGFTVLLSGQKKALDADLAVFDAEPSPLLKHVYRAHVFAKYHLFNQVVTEYQEAFTIAPLDPTLLDAAISATHRTGDFQEERRLRDLADQKKN